MLSTNDRPMQYQPTTISTTPSSTKNMIPLSYPVQQCTGVTHLRLLHGTSYLSGSFLHIIIIIIIFTPCEHYILIGGSTSIVPTIQGASNSVGAMEFYRAVCFSILRDDEDGH
jgi:hypothetical protein